MAQRPIRQLSPGSQLDDEDTRESFARAYVSGASMRELAETYRISLPTCRSWVKDPRVQRLITDGMNERVNRLTRKIDSEIENRINGPHMRNMGLDDLLKIRKEILGPATQRVQVEQTTTVQGPDPTMALWGALDGDPEAMKALGRVLGTPKQIAEQVVDADVVEEGEPDEPVPALGADLAEG